MKTLHVDVAIMGSGSAGMTAYRAARKHTDKIAVIQDGPYGTTCARVGCMPSKLLISAADAAHHTKEAPVFGIYPGNPIVINGQEVMARVRKERDRFVSFVIKDIESYPEAHRILGKARFENVSTIRVNDDLRIETKATVIATGSSPVRLPMFASAGDRLIVNDDLFEWTDLPESVAVFGPGVIGLELGQALHRLGVRVRIFGKGGGLGPISDPEVKKVAEQIFSEEFYLDTDANVESIERQGDKVVLTFMDRSGKRLTEKFDYLLAATGRAPNVHDIGLENTPLECDSRGVPLFDRHTMQCGSHPIFIAGDANNDIPLLHEAADEGKIAGANAAQYPTLSPGARRSPIGVVFSSPQIATVGSAFRELDPKSTEIGEVSFVGQGRSRVMNQNAGMLRVYGERPSGKFLGAEMIGPAAEHIAHLLAWSHQSGLTVKEMLDRPFYHPVIEEGVRTALQSLAKKLRN